MAGTTYQLDEKNIICVRHRKVESFLPKIFLPRNPRGAGRVVYLPKKLNNKRFMIKIVEVKEKCL